MQTKIAYLFMGKNIRLQARLRKQQRGKPIHELSSLLHRKLLKIVCSVVWDIRLMKTSILVTKTPLTTLKCLSRNYIGLSPVNSIFIHNVNARMHTAAKHITDSFSRRLEKFAHERG
jgi:hypothetical protein